MDIILVRTTEAAIAGTVLGHVRAVSLTGRDAKRCTVRPNVIAGRGRCGAQCCEMGVRRSILNQTYKEWSMLIELKEATKVIVVVVVAAAASVAVVAVRFMWLI